ncbi:ferredoxin [Pseudonocardia kongjuensis]
MKLHVDYTRCTGHGLCEVEAEDVFEVGEDGLVQLLVDDPGEQNPRGLEAAVRACPTSALSIED